MYMEKPDSNKVYDLGGMRTTDRVTTWLYQQTHAVKLIDESEMTPGDWEEIAKLDVENNRRKQIKALFREILAELKDIAELDASIDSLREILSNHELQLTKMEIDSLLGEVSHTLTMREIRGIRTNDPKLIGPSKRLGMEFDLPDDES